MTHRIIIGLLILVPIAAGCYQSNVQGDKDAANDSPADQADGLADAVADGVGDNADVQPPPAYALHEWGVMVLDDSGEASMRGPAPEFGGAIPAKPVLYLYSDGAAGPIDIRVNFASGGATETWPAVPLGRTVEWNNLSILAGGCDATPFPSPGSGPQPSLCEACALQTCVVEGANCLSVPVGDGESTAYSKLLFYTGTLPDYQAPIQASADLPDCSPNDCVRYNLANRSALPIDSLWLVYRQTESVCVDPSYCPLKSADIAFEILPGLGAGETLQKTINARHFEVPLDEHGFPVGQLELPEDWNNLGKGLIEKLRAKGLTEKEAGAFMQSWDTLFFGLAGQDSFYLDPLYANCAFVIYFMSRSDYDDQLPLSALPPPQETVRVGMVYQSVPIR